MSQSRGYVRSVVILVILVTWVSHFQAAAEVISVSVPFVSPKGSYVTQQDRYHAFRIPGMIVTQDGSVVVFAEGRRGDGSDPRRDENAPIDLVMRRSTDNGRTWQPMVVIDSGFRPNGDLLDFADPTPVLDAKTGTVFLFYGRLPDVAPRTVAYGQSADPNDGNHIVWVRSSTDNGQTWSDRKQVVYPDEPHETSDGVGYRRDIANGFAPHPELPERWVQNGPKPEEWEQATPGWTKARVQAQGDRIRVFVGGESVLEVRDHTYRAGRAGLMARGPVRFRNLSISGTRGSLGDSWKQLAEEHPKYFYPYADPGKVHGDNQTYPGVCRTVEGDLLVWMSVNGDPHHFNDFLLVRSRDEGQSWGEPVLVKRSADGGKPSFFFGHQDGRLSRLHTYGGESEILGPKVAYFADGGKTWTAAEPLRVSGKPLNARAQKGKIVPYSPITRYSDGTLLQFYYHVQTVEGGSVQSNAERRDRSVVIRSTDDGRTWTGPYYLDPHNFDSNECLGAECSDGSIVAFARTLRSPFMWMSKSKDKGIRWSKQVPSDCTGECPQLLRHSSGVMIMGSRGAGIFMKTSIDEGQSWSRETRISLCSGMMGLTEMKDGRVLVVFHEAYRTPTRMRGHYMRVKSDGSLVSA